MWEIFSKNKFRLGKNLIVTLLLIAIFLPPAYLLMPVRKADAFIFVPVGEIPLAATHVANSVENFLNATVKEFGLDAIAWIVAKQLISAITSDLVTWINSGFNGAPMFVQNLNGFFTDILDKALGEFLSGTQLAFLCSPFKLHIQIALQLNLFKNKNVCRITGILANMDRFLVNGGFLNGGFLGMVQMTNSVHMNMYGSYLMADQSLAMKLGGAGWDASKKLDFGKGFLSFETCTTIPDEFGGPNMQDCKTQTPGAVVESQLEGMLGSGVRQLEIADELDEVVGALISQLLNQVISGGLAALGGGGGGGGGGPTFLGQLRTDILAQRTGPVNAADFPVSGVITGFTPDFNPPAGFPIPTVPPTTGPGAVGGPRFSISSPFVVLIAPGGTKTVPVSLLFQSGSTPPAVSLNVLQLPSIVSNTSFGNDPCRPSCTSFVTFAVTPGAPLGSYQAVISASPEPSNVSTQITIIITNNPDGAPGLTGPAGAPGPIGPIGAPGPTPIFTPPPPSPTGVPFSYAISAAPSISVAPGGVASIVVTKTFAGVASTLSAPILLTAPQQPSVATSVSFGPDSCTLVCTSTVDFTISPTAPTGSYLAVISGSPLPSNTSIQVNVNVSSSAPAATGPDTVQPSISFLPTVVLATAGSPPRAATAVFSVTTSDNVGVTQVDFFADGVLRASVPAGSPFEFLWKANMGNIVSAVAFDAAGNTAAATTFAP